MVLGNQRFRDACLEEQGVVAGDSLGCSVVCLKGGIESIQRWFLRRHKENHALVVDEGGVDALDFLQGRTGLD